MINKIKDWYIALTRGGDIYYSLSDTQFFWITASWLLLLPAVVYATFFAGRGTWKELAVYVVLEVAVLTFKFAKYIRVRHAGTEVELTQGEDKNDEKSRYNRLWPAVRKTDAPGDHRHDCDTPHG